MRLFGKVFSIYVGVFFLLLSVLMIPIVAGDMKPYFERSEQVSAEPVSSLAELGDPRLSEIVYSYVPSAGLITTIYVIRYQEAHNNVGGKCSGVAKEVIYIYADQPMDWFMTRTVTTASGDQIFQELSGIAFPVDVSDPGSDLMIQGQWEITGGNGRFDGSFGLGQLDGFADSTGALYVSAILKGTMSTVGSLKRMK